MHPPMTIPPVTGKHNPKYPKRSFFPYDLAYKGKGGLSATAIKHASASLRMCYGLF